MEVGMRFLSYGITFCFLAFDVKKMCKQIYLLNYKSDLYI